MNEPPAFPIPQYNWVCLVLDTREPCYAMKREANDEDELIGEKFGNELSKSVALLPPESLAPGM